MSSIVRIFLINFAFEYKYNTNVSPADTKHHNRKI